MKNIEVREMKVELNLEILLTNARMDERRNRGEVVAARLQNLANHIQCKELNHVEVAELLRKESEFIQYQAQELH
ncbi:DUF2732 family protein [Hafnia alvei]|uniref:DUF2732 family protein n=1 Tax=Hafnia alvei TaxID=569 RepID=UPI001034FAC3|nr:DUF2732 family protein [Hafnia alvei]TBM18748.1 DUF2732 domain-containing protein [Hafnia alvei]